MGARPTGTLRCVLLCHVSWGVSLGLVNAPSLSPFILPNPILPKSLPSSPVSSLCKPTAKTWTRQFFLHSLSPSFVPLPFLRISLLPCPLLPLPYFLPPHTFPKPFLSLKPSSFRRLQ